jgi:4-amino-4-deoxy-L-arabinose transferase-like glycosyltransferase
MKKLLIKIYYFFGNDRFKISLLFLLIFLSIFSIFAFRPEVSGDSISYVQAIEVIKTGISPDGFIPYRIITTFLGLLSVIAINVLVNNLLASWLILNSLLYIAMGIFFYSLLLKIIDNSRTTFLGTLFLVTNYAAVVFSFHYLMDVGGWAFYVASLYFSFRYLETKENKWLWLSAILVGTGGLFKEYAFLAYVVIFGLIIYTNWKQWPKIIKQIFFSGLLAFGPMIVINTYAFFIYHYTYLSWYSAQSVYVYQNKLIEYIKSFGALYNFGWFLFIGGTYLLLKRSKEILLDQKLFFIWLVILSALPAFLWAAITERILFIFIPAFVIISSLFIKKIGKMWYIIIPILIFYALSSYFMDSFILDFVNLPF